MPYCLDFDFIKPYVLHFLTKETQKAARDQFEYKLAQNLAELIQNDGEFT